MLKSTVTFPSDKIDKKKQSSIVATAATSVYGPQIHSRCGPFIPSYQTHQYLSIHTNNNQSKESGRNGEDERDMCTSIRGWIAR